jgi:hypothetical protein
MTFFISPEDLGTYLGATVDIDRAQFLIDQATDLCSSIVDPLPDAASSVVLDVAARAYANPTSVPNQGPARSRWAGRGRPVADPAEQVHAAAPRRFRWGVHHRHDARHGGHRSAVVGHRLAQWRRLGSGAVTFPFGRDVSLVRRSKSGTDAYGNDAFTTTSTVVSWCLRPRRFHRADPGPERAHHPADPVPAPGTDVSSVDAVDIDGDRFEVDGSPNDWVNPFTGWNPGVEVRLGG